jgi:hypothetical protein
LKKYQNIPYNWFKFFYILNCIDKRADRWVSSFILCFNAATFRLEKEQHLELDLPVPTNSLMLVGEFGF